MRLPFSGNSCSENDFPGCATADVPSSAHARSVTPSPSKPSWCVVIWYSHVADPRSSIPLFPTKFPVEYSRSCVRSLKQFSGVPPVHGESAGARLNWKSFSSSRKRIVVPIGRSLGALYW